MEKYRYDSCEKKEPKPSEKVCNRRRAKKLEGLLKSIYDECLLKSIYDEYAGKENVIDALTDLRHLCRLKGWDFDNCTQIADIHFRAEK